LNYCKNGRLAILFFNYIWNTMQICLALLLNNEIHNKIRRLVFEINSRYKTGIVASLLPQHISLNETFYHGNIDEICDYIINLAKSLCTAKIYFDKLELIESANKTGLIWWKVSKNDWLNDLHNQIVFDLENRFAILKGSLNGANFNFHSTIIYGSNMCADYKKIFDDYKNYLANETCFTDEIALFCSHEEKIVAGSFYTYHIEKFK